jgi:4'-phosphopantetheinyl transferase
MVTEPEIQLVRSDGPAGDDLDALSEEERAGLAALRSEAARRERTAGRAVVRRRLGTLHALAPRDVPLEIGPSGRPFSPLGPPFSIAHAGGLVAVAFAERDVGIDIEPVVPLDDVDRLTRAYASDVERRVIAALPRPARDHAFLTMWVRKESVLKASSLGLAYDPRDFGVGDDTLSFDGRLWRVRTLALGTAHVGAIALEVGETRARSIKLP